MSLFLLVICLTFPATHVIFKFPTLILRSNITHVAVIFISFHIPITAMAEKKEQITLCVRIPEALRLRMKKYVEEGQYLTESDFVREVIRNELARAECKPEEVNNGKSRERIDIAGSA